MASVTVGSATRSKRAESTALKRDVGFLGLLMVSLGSIIGSGWLLGATYAAQAAGPASLISWVLAGVMLTVLALIHAELGTTYPVAGGTGRFPAFAFGSFAGFVAGWSAWLQAVTIAPIEVEASLQYLNNLSAVKNHVSLVQGNDSLTGYGLVAATILMLLFTTLNIIGIKALADSNTGAVVWKTIVPVLTIVVLLVLSFHGGNFHDGGGGFMPFGMHGVFAALPAGVVFALQGFEQAIQVGGEAKNPQKDIARAVILAMLIGVVVYTLLEVAFLGSLNPASIAKGWSDPIGTGGYGPYATLATAAGASWLAYVLYADAFISPAATGMVYVGTSSRLSYALGRGHSLPSFLSTVKRGVPIGSILLAFVIGEISFLPFPSWQSLVGLVTSATAIMYAFAPVSLTALRMRDGERERPYRLPAGQVLAPLGFVFANLIVYWGGFEATWKISVGLLVGVALYVLTHLLSSRAERPDVDLGASWWIPVWLVGLIVIGRFGRYGSGAANDIPAWVDLVVVIAWALVVFVVAVHSVVSAEKVQAAVAAEVEEMERGPELAVAG